MTIPSQLNHYRILEPLGKGGMGEVFAAEDTRLRRKVAIKVLSELTAADPERRQRFEREAQAIAALNHPNIVTIYGVEEAAGVPYIAMELVEGRPLSDAIKAGGLSLTELLRVGAAVSDAIGAAHQRGITHRDLKPANVMLGTDGRVKVLDFGLAKLREAEAEYDGETRLPSGDLTGEGRIIGTVAYMSPEQAEGKPVDPRSDIFSLGVMLHEMATGERPFRGDTNVSIISSILKDTPEPITDVNPALPAGLAKIIRRALSKDPSRRYQTATDLRNELDELKQDVASGVSTITSVLPRPTPAPSTRRWGIAAAAAVLASAAVALAVYGWRGRSDPEMAAFVPSRFTRLTTTGSARLAAMSGDGRYVVHIKAEGPEPSLWIRQTAAASDVQIVAPAPVRYDGLSFSPDGNYIYYSAYQRTGGVAWLYRLPVLGGTAERILEDVDSAVSLSPDGRQFAFIRGFPADSRNYVMIANVDGSNVRKVGTSAGMTQVGLDAAVWSPDGRTILTSGRSLEGGAHGVCLLFDVASGAVSPVGGRWAGVNDVAWRPDGRSFLVVGADLSASQTSQIWQVSHPSGERRRVTVDLNNYAGVSLSADGASVATVQSEINSTLSIAPSTDLTKGVPLSRGRSRGDGLQGLAWTGDGRLLFGSSASGGPQIWIVDADGSGLRQLTTTTQGIATAPATPANDAFVIYQQSKDDGMHVYRTALDGADTRQLTNGAGEFAPIVTPDGKWVYFSTLSSSGQVSMRVPSDGGTPTPVDDSGFFATAVSPDGARMLGTMWDVENRRSSLALLPLSGGKPELLRLPVVSSSAWAPDGTSIIYVDFVEGTLAMVSYDLERRSSRTLQTFPGDSLLAFAWSRDGQRVAIARGSVASDVVILASK